MAWMVGSGEIGGALLVLAVAILIAFLIDDDDLPGPRRCFAAVLGR